RRARSSAGVPVRVSTESSVFGTMVACAFRLAPAAIASASATPCRVRIVLMLPWTRGRCRGSRTGTRAPAATVRRPARPSRGARGQLEALEQALAPGARLAGIEPADRGQEGQVLGGRQLLVEARLLGGVSDPPPRLERLLVEAHAADGDAAAVRELESGGAAD